MLKVGIIGIGNAGNQVADLAKRVHNFDGFAINSSKDDILNAKTIDGIVIGDDKGAGKDRDIAKDFLRSRIKDVMTHTRFAELVTNNEVIVVPTSTGGGTGSAMAPVLTDILKRYYPEKRIIPIGILPPIKESAAAQQNTIDYLKEIRMSNPTYMLYDNNRRSNKPTNEMMLDINREIVDDLAIIRGDYQLLTPYTSIDDRDSLKIYETPGRMVVVKAFGFKEKDVEDKSIEDRLIENLRSNTHAELDRDQIIKRLGLITNLSERMHKSFDAHLPKFKDIVGEPIEGFEHIYVNENEDETNRVVVVMSGLSMPDDRIEKIVQRLDEVRNALTKTKETSILDSADTGMFKDLRSTGTTTGNNVKDVDFDDIFDKYNK